jgi:hypothetical protein
MPVFAAIYGEESLLQVLFVTCVIGGGAAWLAGHRLANNWQPLPKVILYLCLLGAGVRFVHFALFIANPFSVPAYLCDTMFVILVGSLSWRLAQVRRMIQQYRWLYERRGLLGWRERDPQGRGN